MRNSLSYARFERLFRWAPAVVLLIGFIAGVFVPRLAVEAQAETESHTYTVMAGGGTLFNTDILAFAPQSLQVHRGDTVMWAIGGFHNIHFEETLSELVIMSEMDGKPLAQLNPAIAFPTVENGGVFQGGDVNSGIGLDPANPMVTFSLVMDVDPGTYAYFCDIHPGMVGTITVVDEATAIPSPSEALAAGVAQLAGQGGQAVEAAMAASLAPQTVGDDGAVQISAGIQAGSAAVLGFFPTVAVIEPGQSVTWSIAEDSMEPHTVTWPALPPGSEVTVIPQDAGPPIIALSEHAFPSIEDGAVVNAGDSFNTGFMFPGQSFTLTFSDPGVYNYVCFIHPGMRGTVVVMPPS